jgi:ribosomal protein L29
MKMTLQELAERVEKLEREVAELKAMVGKRTQPTKITPEELERRRKAVAAILEFADRLRGRGVTLTDILMEMRYGSGKWCD